METKLNLLLEVCVCVCVYTESTSWYRTHPDIKFSAQRRFITPEDKCWGEAGLPPDGAKTAASVSTEVGFKEKREKSVLE